MMPPRMGGWTQSGLCRWPLQAIKHELEPKLVWAWQRAAERLQEAATAPQRGDSPVCSADSDTSVFPSMAPSVLKA